MIHTECSAIGILSNEQADLSYPKLAIFTDVAKCINIFSLYYLSLPSALRNYLLLPPALYTEQNAEHGTPPPNVSSSSMMGSKHDIASLVNTRVDETQLSAM